jgi:hypothetical protein
MECKYCLLFTLRLWEDLEIIERKHEWRWRKMELDMSLEED